MLRSAHKRNKQGGMGEMVREAQKWEPKANKPKAVKENHIFKIQHKAAQ